MSHVEKSARTFEKCFFILIRLKKRESLMDIVMFQCDAWNCSSRFVTSRGTDFIIKSANSGWPNRKTKRYLGP